VLEALSLREMVTLASGEAHGWTVMRSPKSNSLPMVMLGHVRVAPAEEATHVPPFDWVLERMVQNVAGGGGAVGGGDGSGDGGGGEGGEGGGCTSSQQPEQIHP
jgi:hypothetical protein